TRRVKRRQLIKAHPIEIGAALQKVRGRFVLPTVTGAPECCGDFGGWRCVRVVKQLSDAVHQTERRGLPQVRSRAAFDKPASGLPLAEPPRVSEWSAAADDCSRRFDVRTAIEQRIQDFDVVTAGGQ